MKNYRLEQQNYRHLAAFILFDDTANNNRAFVTPQKGNCHEEYSHKWHSDNNQRDVFVAHIDRLNWQFVFGAVPNFWTSSMVNHGITIAGAGIKPAEKVVVVKYVHTAQRAFRDFDPSWVRYLVRFVTRIAYIGNENVITNASFELVRKAKFRNICSGFDLKNRAT